MFIGSTWESQSKADQEDEIRNKIAKEFENSQTGRIVWGASDIAKAVRNPELHGNKPTFGTYPEPKSEGPSTKG
jgi:hypothetical protein